MALASGGYGRRCTVAVGSRVTVVCLALVALSTTHAPAQERVPERRLDQLEVGDSVRLRVTGAVRLDGALRGVRGDTLVLRVAGIEAPWPVPSSNLVTLERYAERNPREGFRHGAMTGLMVGLFAGAAAGAAIESSRSHAETDLAAGMISAALTWGGAGAALGAVTGGIVGGARPGRGWVGLSLPTR